MKKIDKEKILDEEDPSSKSYLEPNSTSSSLKKITIWWMPYSPIGNQVPGTRFIAFKVPLRETFVDKLKPEDRFTVPILLERVPELGLIIDLTQTLKYYNKNEVLDRGVDYVKIPTPGQLVPTQQYVDRFFEVVDYYLDTHKNDDSLIGVHCTHGVNRTGYMLCRYLIQRLGYTFEEAVEAVGTARGHMIERSHYLTSLRDHTESVQKRTTRGDIEEGKSKMPKKSLPPKAKKLSDRPAVTGKERFGRRDNPYPAVDRRSRSPRERPLLPGQFGDFGPGGRERMPPPPSVRDRMEPPHHMRGRTPPQHFRGSSPPSSHHMRGRSPPPPHHFRGHSPPAPSHHMRGRSPPPPQHRGRSPPPQLRGRTPPSTHHLRGRTSPPPPPQHLRGRSPGPPSHMRGRTPPHVRGRSPPPRGRSPPMQPSYAQMHSETGRRTPPGAHTRGHPSPHHIRGRSPPQPHVRGRTPPPPHVRGRTPPPHLRGRSPTESVRGRTSPYGRGRSPPPLQHPEGGMSRIPVRGRTPPPSGHLRTRTPPPYYGRGRTPPPIRGHTPPTGPHAAPASRSPGMYRREAIDRTRSPPRGREAPPGAGPVSASGGRRGEPFPPGRRTPPPAPRHEPPSTRGRSPIASRRELPPSSRMPPEEYYRGEYENRRGPPNEGNREYSNSSRTRSSYPEGSGPPIDYYTDPYGPQRRERSRSPLQPRDEGAYYAGRRKDISPSRDKRRRKSPNGGRDRAHRGSPYPNGRELPPGEHRGTFPPTWGESNPPDDGPDCREILNERRSMREPYPDSSYEERKRLVERLPPKNVDLRESLEEEKRRKMGYGEMGYPGADYGDKKRARPDHPEYPEQPGFQYPERANYEGDSYFGVREQFHQQGGQYEGGNEYRGDNFREEFRGRRGGGRGGKRVFERLSRGRRGGFKN